MNKLFLSMAAMLSFSTIAFAGERTFDLSSRGVNQSPPNASKQMVADLRKQSDEVRSMNISASEIGVTSVIVNDDGRVTVKFIIVEGADGNGDFVETPELEYSSLSDYRFATGNNPRLSLR